MKLYLVRHGEATQAVEDSTRPLSATGIKEVTLMGNFLQSIQPQIDLIYHSGKKRAEQTATILATKLNLVPKVSPLIGLQPDDAVKPIAVYCNHWHQDAMLVGHLPFMAKLVSELLFENDSWPFLEFQTASVVCLQRTSMFRWNILWFVTPKLLQAFHDVDED